MPPNHQKRIEDADLWDILDWDVTAALAAMATGDPRDNRGANALPWTAKLLIDAASREGSDDIAVFHRIFTAYVTATNDAGRRRSAGELAGFFGADPERLIEFVAFKWGLFKRTT